MGCTMEWVEGTEKERRSVDTGAVLGFGTMVICGTSPSACEEGSPGNSVLPGAFRAEGALAVGVPASSTRFGASSITSTSSPLGASLGAGF